MTGFDFRTLRILVFVMGFQRLCAELGSRKIPKLATDDGMSGFLLGWGPSGKIQGQLCLGVRWGRGTKADNDSGFLHCGLA